MSDENNNPADKPEDKSQEFRKALRRMFERKSVEEQIEEIEKIAGMGKLPKDNPPNAATDD